MKKLYLIDGYGFVFRAYHSLPPLTKSDGFPIGCVYGFTNMLHKILQTHDADYIAVALDSGGSTFRHQLYNAYKSNRPEPDPQLVLQFPLIREAVEAFNIKALAMPGIEADDIIAAYALTAEKQGYEVHILSSDKDLMQLITPQIHMFDPLRNITIDEQKVVEKFGVPPAKIRDYLALIGDSSDHIPGVAGIGPKGATDLLSQFDNLDDIYNNIDKIAKDRTKKLLLDSKDNAYLSQELIDLKKDRSVLVDLDSLKRIAIDNNKLYNFLLTHEFKNLLTKFKPTVTVEAAALIETHDIEEVVKQANREAMIALIYDEQYLYIAFGKLHYKIPYSQMQPSLFDENKSITLPALLQSLKGILEDKAILKILVDAKSWYKQLKQQNISLVALEDVMIMAYALTTGKPQVSFTELLAEYISSENLQHAEGMLKLYQVLKQELLKQKTLTIYENIEKPMIAVLAEMEILGVKIDPQFLKTLNDEFSNSLHALEKKIYVAAGREFLISSPKQLSEILFTDLSIAPIGKKSKSGAYATGAEVLEKLSDMGFDIADDLLQWRQFSKLISTYTGALPAAINPATGRVHSTFEMASTTTGRISSRHPNLQNIPIRQAEGQRIRHAFNASHNHAIISADYSQIELRLLAHIAQIKSLQQAFANGDDIHAITASQIFEVPVTAVDANLRRKAKTINFGIIYGISAFGLAKRLDIPQHEAKVYIEQYFKQYPGIKAYMDDTIHFAKEHGYVFTIFGRRCYINGINDKNYTLRGFAERAAINAPLQGSSADIIKKAMSALPEEIRKTMILQIHDELLFEVALDKVEEYQQQIKKVMENVAHLPLVVDVGNGKSWAEC